MNRRGDPHRLLMRAVQDKAGRDGRAEIVATRSEAWASATFRGARHSLSLQLDGDDAADRATRLAESLGVTEFRLPGHLVADIALIARCSNPAGVAVEIEALTLEEG
jgi:hypothetical protein